MSAERRGAACESGLRPPSLGQGRFDSSGRAFVPFLFRPRRGSENSTPQGRGAVVRGALRSLLPSLLCLALHAALAPGAAAQTPVPHDWELTPSGLDTGDKFRLLFVSTIRTTAGPSNIQYYNEPLAEFPRDCGSMRALTLWRTLLSLGCRPCVWFYRTGVTREAETGGFDTRPS